LQTRIQTKSGENLQSKHTQQRCQSIFGKKIRMLESKTRKKPSQFYADKYCRFVCVTVTFVIQIQCVHVGR